jgi:hypothetical protein
MLFSRFRLALHALKLSAVLLAAALVLFLSAPLSKTPKPQNPKTPTKMK